MSPTRKKKQTDERDLIDSKRVETLSDSGGDLGEVRETKLVENGL